MRRLAILLQVLLIGLLMPAAAVQSEDQMTARVLEVIDGDSIVVLTPGNTKAEIKLHGIDCPEEGQPFGDDARQFTSNQCLGKIIFYGLVGIDIYHRTIATVVLEDGRELNLELLKAGLAWHHQRYGEKPNYAQAEEEARKAGLGLWSDKDPTPPWEWRQQKRKKP